MGPLSQSWQWRRRKVCVCVCVCVCVKLYIAPSVFLMGIKDYVLGVSQVIQSLLMPTGGGVPTDVET